MGLQHLVRLRRHIRPPVVVPANAFYFAANGSGNGQTIGAPALFNIGDVNTQLQAGKIVKMLGPAVTPAPDADPRPDEFFEDAYGHIVEVPGTIEFIAHPANPGGPRGTFVGSREKWILPADPEEVTDFSGKAVGGTGLVLRAPCVIRGINARRMGTVINFDTNNAAHGTIIEDFSGYNIQRFNDTLQRVITSGVGRTTEVNVNDVIIRRGELIGYSKAAIRAMHYCQDWLIEDVTGNSGRQANDSFARLIVFDYFAQRMLVRRCIGRNAHMTTGSYRNGDACVEWNDGNRFIVIEDCEGYGATDGGFDGKGFDAILRRCVSGDNKRQYRVWCDGLYEDCTSLAPHNRGDVTNGRAHIFIAGSFEPNRATDPLAGFASSEYRGRGYFRRPVINTAGQDAGTATILTEAGAIGHLVNGIIDGQPLTYANMGFTQIHAESKVIVYQGSEDPADIGCEIITPMVQTAPESTRVNIALQARNKAGAVNTECYWELDREHPGVKDNSVRLSSWVTHNPVLSFDAPPAPGVFSIDVTVIDAAKNRITQTLTVASQVVGETDAPAVAGHGAIAYTKNSATVTNVPLPAVFANDIIYAYVYSNAAGVNHPSIPGFELDPDLSNVQDSTFKTWKLWRRCDGTEAPNHTASFWSDGPINASVPGDPGTVACSAVNNSTIHAVKFVVVRYARQAGKPYELASKANIGQPPIPPPLPAPQTYLTPTAGAGCNLSIRNRLLLSVFTARNDIKDGVVDASTPDWSLNDSQWVSGANTGDMTFTTMVQKATEAKNYPGGKLFWTQTARTYHLTDCVAFLPREDPP